MSIASPARTGSRYASSASASRAPASTSRAPSAARPSSVAARASDRYVALFTWPSASQSSQRARRRTTIRRAASASIRWINVRGGVLVAISLVHEHERRRPARIAPGPVGIVREKHVAVAHFAARAQRAVGALDLAAHLAGRIDAVVQKLALHRTVRADLQH